MQIATLRLTSKLSTAKSNLPSTLRLIPRSSWPKNIRFTILRPTSKSFSMEIQMYIWTPCLTPKLSLMRRRPKLIVSFTPSAASTTMKIKTSQSSDKEEVQDVSTKDHVEGKLLVRHRISLEPQENDHRLLHWSVCHVSWLQ